MNDKLKKLYDLYVESGIIQTSSFEEFAAVNDQQRKKLYDLGKQKGLFQTTDYNSFNSVFNVKAPVKKKSTTVSPSVQKKKPTSSGTMPSWMQSYLEQSSKKEQAAKKTVEQQRQGVYVSKEEAKGPEIKGTGGQYGFTVAPVSKEQKAINASVGSKVYSGFPGQEENKYRVKNNRWERLYGKNWVEVTNNGSVNALNNYFEKNLSTLKGEIKEDKEDLKRMRSVLRVEEEIASGKEYNEKQFEERVQYYNTIETQKYLKSKGYDIDVNGIKNDPKTLKALASSKAKKKIDQDSDFEIEDMRDAVDGIITNKFLMRTEEDAISVLRKQFGKYGFTFEESGVGTDYIKVTTPGQVVKEFGFDYSNPEIARAEALNMSNFIKKGYMTKKEKKQFEGEDVDMDNRSQRDEYFFDLVNLMGKNPYKYSTDLFSYGEINNGISRIYSDLKAESKSLEYEYEDIEKRIKKFNENPDDVNEKIAIDKDLYALKKKGFEIKEKYDKLSGTEKNLQKITGLEYAKKEKQGNFLGIITGQFAQGFTNVEKALLNLSADILPYALGEDVIDSQTRLRLENEGYTESQMRDYAAKQLKRTVVKDITEGITRVATAGSTTKEYINSEDRNDFEKTVSFLSESIGTAFSSGGNPVLQKVAFFTQSYNNMEEQMSSPEFDGLTEWEKKLISVPYGFVIGALERYGFAALGAGKNPIVDKFATRVIGLTMKSLPKDASISTIKREINKNVSRMIGDGTLRVVGGAFVEGATEGTQQLAEIVEKNIVNDITKKDYFKDVPDLSTAKGIGEALDIAKTDAYYGFLGGLLYSTVSNSVSVRREYKLGKKTDEEFKLFYDAMTDTKIVQSNKLQVKIDLKEGKITKEEAKERIDSINDMNAKLNSINSNLSLRDKKEAFNLILEREKLTKEKAPLDEALQAPYNDRITEINNELKVISENATKESEQQQQEGTAEGGVVQREGVVEGQPEVGQGEGTVGQATEQGTDIGDRTVEGRSQEEIDTRVSELEAMLANDAASVQETGMGSLLPEAKAQIQSELEALKAEKPIEMAAEMPTEMPEAKGAPKIAETTDTKAYSEALSEAKAELKAEGNGLDLQVSDVSQEEADAIVAEGGKIFMTEDGLAGAYVKKDGYMGGLFKSPKATYKKVAKLLQQARIKVGGRFMDAYATELEKIYIENGFRPVARLKFNEEYAPEGWDAPGSALASKPDVVFFAYDPDGKYSIGDGEYVTDYDAAYEMAKNFDSKVSNEADKLAELMKGSTVVEGTEQQVDALIKEISNSEDVVSERYVLEAVNNATKALRAILPNVKFVLHSTDESFREAIGETNETDSSRGAYDPGKKVIHINLTKANRRTVMHEVFHAIIVSKVSSDAKLQSLTKNMVKSVMKSLKQSGANQNVITYLEKFSAGYEAEEQNEEKLSELFALLGETYKSLPYPTQNIIQRFLDRVAKMFGLKEMTDREVVDFMNSLSGRVEAGIEISPKRFDFKNQEPGSNSFVGTINVIRKSKGIPAPSVKDDSRDFIRNLVEDIDIREFNGEKFVTNMYDYTNAGETDLGNGLIINLFGGKNYVPYMMSINNKKIGDVSNLAAFNTKAQAETFIRNSKNGGANLFAPHSGTKSQSWQFQQHTFAELVKLIIKNKLLTNAELISTFNKTIEGNAALKVKFNKFKTKYGVDIKDFSAFESDPMQIVDLLDIKNNLSPDLRKALNNAIASDKKFQKILGINNKQDFYNKIMDPLNVGVEGGEIMGIVDFDPNTFEIVQTSPNDMDHHPSFGWTLMAKINGIYQPTEFHKSSDITDTYTKYNKKGPDVSIKENEPKFEQKNVSSSAGAIPKVAEFKIKKQKPLQPEVAEKLTEDGKGNFVFNHYSDKKREVIKPGTGQNIITSREEGSALSAVGGLAQYYTMDMQKEMGTGPNQHTILIPMDRVYYFNKDQDGFYDEAKRRFEEVRPGQAFSPNYQVAFITQVANDNGYDIVVANWRNGELRAQTTLELTPSDKIINFKPLKEVTYEVGDTIEVYGGKAKITAIDGDIITFKGETTGGTINFKRSPKSIQKVATPKEQVEEEVNSLEEEMKPNTDKTKSEIYKELLDDVDINSLRRSLRMKDPNGFTIELLDELQKAKKDESLSVSDEVNDMLENGITLSTIKGMLIDEEVFLSGKEVDNYFIQIGGDKTKGIFNRLAGLKSESDTDKSNFKKQKPSKQKAKKQADVIVKTGKKAGLSDAGIREYMKRNGYTDRQAIDAIQAYNDKQEGIFIDPDWSSLRKAAVLFKRKYFVSRGLLAKTVFSENESRLATIAKQLNIAQKLIVDFDRELEVIRKNSVAQYEKDVRAYIKGDKTVNLPAEIKTLIDSKTGIKDRVKLTFAIKKLAKENVEKHRADFDAYIRDKAAVLPLELKKIADSMRAHIDSISRELISNGLIDEHLAERVIDNLGSYLNRSYKIYDRKNWKKEVQKEVKQKAINFLKIQLRPIAEEQAKKDNRDVDETLNDLVKSKIAIYLSQQEEDMKLFSSGGKLGSKNLSTLKAKEDIPVEIRMLMGEYTDPGQNYARTILKMSALAANHQFLNQVKKAGTGVFLFEENDSKKPESYTYQIASEGSETMNPLNGMYTSEEIGKAFEKEVSQLNKFWSFYMSILSRVKWGKTILSPMTHAKNLIGNIGFVLVNGHWRINEMATAYKAVRDDIRSLDKKESREYVNKLIELGIIKQSAGVGELRAMFADASWEETMINNINKNTGSGWGKIKSGWNRFTRGSENVYQAEDDFYKVFAYENELSRYSKAMFGKSKKELTPDERAEVDKVVAEIVKNTYPTYSRIPEAVNMIRRAPLIGNFVSFQAESYRTAYMTAQLALQEIKSDNPKIRLIGAQRMTGALLYKSIKLGILSYYSSAAGMGAVGILGYFFDDDEEKQKEDDVRKFLPEWSKNSDIVVKQASNGKIKYIDMSASDPHGGMNKAINSLLLGETTLNALINGFGSVIEPFVGEEMTTAAILSLKNNQDAYGQPIYNPEDTLYEKSKDITGFIFNTVQPGIVSSGRRIAKADNVLEEVTGAVTGARTYEIDVAENFGYSMINYRDRLENAKRIYNSEVYAKDATDKSIADAKKRAENAVTKIHKEIYERYYSAVRLGANEDVLFDNIKRFARMSDIDMRFMFANIPYLLEEKYAE